MNPRRLYRSRDRQLAGVAGGMAEYLNIDPTVSRILWILAAIFTGGLVILAYIVLAIITPESPWVTAGPAPSGQPGYGPAGWATPPASPSWSPDYAAQSAAQQVPAAQQVRGRGLGAAAIVGVVLIVIGGIALVDAALPGWSSAVILGPAVILALGAALLVASIRRQAAPAVMPSTPAGEPTGPAASEPTGPVAPAAGGAPGAPGAAPAATYQGTDTQLVDPTSLT